MHKYGLISSLERGWTFSSLIKSSSIQFKIILNYHDDAKEDVEECPPINNKLLLKSADQFDHWMKTYNHPQQSDNEHLIGWLNEDSGFKHIKNYEALCQLAEQLRTRGYSTTNPPCHLKKFEHAQQNYSSEMQYRRNRGRPGIFLQDDRAREFIWRVLRDTDSLQDHDEQGNEDPENNFNL